MTLRQAQDETATPTVRTRFAPSPTGTPHIGNLRSAMFDWLAARHAGGAFILRIEDTDRTRYVESSLAELYESLRWLGLEWDEGPEIGGPYAPYVQSERLELYQAAARRLVDAGNAYECYCSSERLDFVRNQQREAKLPPGYDGRCRSEAGRAEAKRESGGDRHVVRFRAPESGVTIVKDLLRDEVEFQNAKIEDAVLLKSDGFPTYHLAVVVDDHAMGITHVIRGDEWLPSAPLHKLVYDALGYAMPVLVHTPVILGPDKGKLSKRHGAQSVLEYRDQGYLPEAVFNFLGLLGWSLDDKTEIISRDEFVEHFDLDRLIKSPAKFDIEKLKWLNGEYLRAMDVDQLTALLLPWLEQPAAHGGLPDTVARPLDAEYTRRVVPLIRERVRLLPEAVEMMGFFYLADGVEPEPAQLLGKAFANDPSKAKALLSEALVAAETVTDWTGEALEADFRALATRLEVRAGDLFMLMRVAITARGVAPPLFETMAILGRERCVFRLREALNLAG